MFSFTCRLSPTFKKEHFVLHQISRCYNYKSQDNLTNLLQLSVLSFFRI